MKPILRITALLLLLLGWTFVTNAQSGQPEPALMPELEPITAANASRLQPIAELGVDLINDVAWSPDGKTLAIAGSAGLWRYDVQKLDSQPELIEGYGGLFRSVAFSPDGKTIAMGNDIGLIQLWDAQDWTKRSALQKTGHSVEKLTFSPDGKLVAVGNDDSTIQVLNAQSGKMIQTWGRSNLNRNQITSLDFSSDNTLLVAVGGGRATIFDIVTGKSMPLADIYQAHSAAFSADGELIAVASPQSDGEGAGPNIPLDLWDAKSGQHLKSISAGYAGASGFYTVTFGANGTLLANDGENTLVWRTHDLLNAPENNLLDDQWPYADAEALVQQKLPGGDDIEIGPDLNTMAVIKNSAVQLIDTQTGSQKAQFQLPGFDSLDNRRVRALAFSPAEPLLAFGNGMDIRLFNTQTGQPQGVLTGHEKYVLSLLFTQDGKRLFSGGGGEPNEWSEGGSSEDGGLRLWDVQNRSEVHVFRGYTNSVSHLGLSADGRFIVTLYDAKLWDWAAEKPIDLPEDPIHFMAFSPTSPLAALVTYDYPTNKSGVLLWDMGHNLRIPLLENQEGVIDNIQFSPDGALLAIPVGKTIQLWDVKTGKMFISLPGSAPLAFSPDGKLLAYIDGEYKGLVVYNLQGGSEQAHITVPMAGLFSPLLFSPDGSFIFYNGFLCDAQTGDLLFTLNDGTIAYEAPYADLYPIVDMSHDRKLIALTYGGGVRLWGDPQN